MWSRFDRISKLDAITRIGKFYQLSAPLNTSHSFYPIEPRARAKMVGIVDKVYSSRIIGSPGQIPQRTFVKYLEIV